MILKSKLEFLNERDFFFNWALIENFIRKVSLEKEFDDTHDEYKGFKNIFVHNIETYHHLGGVHEFVKAEKIDGEVYDKLIVLLNKHKLQLSNISNDEELIIEELNHLHKDVSAEEYLKSRDAVETEDGWNCDFILRLSQSRTNLIEKGKFVVKLNKVKGIQMNSCYLNTLEGAPLLVEGELEFTQGNYINQYMAIFYKNNVKKGIKNFNLEFLNYLISTKPEEINNIKWPDNFLNDNLKNSAKRINKFNL